MVVSTGFAVVSAIVGIGKLVVLVTTLGLELTSVFSMLVSVAGTDVVVSAMTVVEDSVGPVLTTFEGFFVDKV